MITAEGLSIELACRVLGVSVSGYYEWLNRAPAARALRHAWLTELIIRAHTDSRGIYGARRVHAELTLGLKISVGRQAVELLMRRAGLQGLSGRPRYRRVPNVATAGDHVERQFARSGRDQLWVTDITEHPTREGKVYCAVVLDAFSRRVVGWSIDGHPQRPGDAVHVLDVHPASCRLGTGAVDGLRWGLLRQRDDRIILEPHAGRTSRSEAMEDSDRTLERDLRVSRNLPQLAPATLGAWHGLTHRV